MFFPQQSTASVSILQSKCCENMKQTQVVVKMELFSKHESSTRNRCLMEDSQASDRAALRMMECLMRSAPGGDVDDVTPLGILWEL